MSELPDLGESRATFPAKLNAYIAALTARVDAFGGSMTLPLPNVSDPAQAGIWDSLLNDYLIELEGRVTVLEGGVGGTGNSLMDGSGNIITGAGDPITVP